MSREIKFRYWNAETKQLLKVNFINFLCETVELFTDVLSLKGVEVSFSPEKLMEFTGLYDKNGKEIYEGDIVQGGYISDNWDPFYLTKVVGNIEYRDATFQIKDRRLSSYEELEVLGNIYENPELLEDK